jgi:UDP-N-acetylglucosamine 2-epimerase
VITAPNIEIDRNIIMGYIENIVNSNKDYHFVESLGINRYLSLIPHCKFVIGNSSSGINEVPFFRIPTINIGDRQKGRIRHESIVDTDYSVSSIVKGIKIALEPNFRKRLKKMKYKFGDGHAAERILKILKDIKINEQFMRKELDFSAYE